jgi:hypothetical protein
MQRKQTMLKFEKAAIAGLAFLFAGAMAPAQAGPAEDAKALGEKGAALIVAQGEKAFDLLNESKGEYVKGDIYVTVIDHKGLVRANINPKLIGMNMWEATDPDGVKFAQEAIKIADSTGSGWETYRYTNPSSKKIEHKKAWIQKAGEFVVMCGYYEQ